MVQLTWDHVILPGPPSILRICLPLSRSHKWMYPSSPLLAATKGSGDPLIVIMWSIYLFQLGWYLQTLLLIGAHQMSTCVLAGTPDPSCCQWKQTVHNYKYNFKIIVHGKLTTTELVHGTQWHHKHDIVHRYTTGDNVWDSVLKWSIIFSTMSRAL